MDQTGTNPLCVNKNECLVGIGSNNADACDSSAECEVNIKTTCFDRPVDSRPR